ncbi:MAG TPA: sigma 54-interacting transcriptional regulator, partial [Polyangiaceae bacterium]|nr:sigma 54-interacting transcriptional regulator [Polyangiaceae bacterium]
RIHALVSRISRRVFLRSRYSSSEVCTVSRDPKPTPYTAQPTAPSAPDGHSATHESLWVVWFGPSGERLESQLGSGTLRIGREPSNDLVLGGSEVSRRHADVAFEAGQWRIADVGSRNGVLLDGQRRASGPLKHGTVLRLGDWVGVVSRGVVERFGEVAPGLWGGGELARALSAARIAAPSRLSIIIEGETGTGKELLAKAIYGWSGVSGAFVAVNCAALSESLLESELFGHVRGAFTGALGDRLGHLREADGGLLFLDEIGELPPSAQAKLLRALQEQEVTPVGTSKRVAVRLRVVAATHRNLRQMVQTGAFRADLLARLEGLVVCLPALRERRTDIVPLFRDFAAAQLRRAVPPFSAELVAALSLYGWPGNVRELKQLADRTAILHASRDRWGVRQVELAAASPSAAPPLAAAGLDRPSAAPASPAKRSLTRLDLMQALEAAGGVVAQAARALEISKQTLYKLLAEHDVDVRPYRGKQNLR